MAVDNRPSIAVLPLNDLTGDRERRYFAPGMHATLIAELGRIGGLRVKATSTVMRYQDSDLTVSEIAEELGVDVIVEGSVFLDGSNVRITVEAIDPASENQLLANSYVGNLGNMLELHGRVAGAIAEEIQVELTTSEQTFLTGHQPVNPVAEDRYLRGLFLLNEGTEPALNRAIDLFEESIALDSTNALPYAKLAETFAVLASYNTLEPSQVFPGAAAAAQRAVQLDPSLADAHAAVGVVRLVYDLDWSGAESELLTAIELNPSYAYAHHFYSWYLTGVGRMEEAIEEFEIAIDLNRFSKFANADFGLILHLSNNSARAVEQLERTLEMDQNFDYTHWWLGLSYLSVGDPDRGLAHLRQAAQLSPDSPKILGAFGYGLAVTGHVDEAREVLARMLEASESGWFPPYDIAMVYVGLAEADDAFNWLEKALEAHDNWIAWVNAQPAFASLRHLPRYEELLNRMRYPGTRE